jgi:hypothetical protein
VFSSREFVFSFVLLLYGVFATLLKRFAVHRADVVGSACSCDVHLRSLYSAPANITITMQLRFYSCLSLPVKTAPRCLQVACSHVVIIIII